ncbi:phosphoglucomutase/phosphomannomutase family protein [Mucilaginibacter sp. RS28]|uniref:Phosphoglucomutase/phosphomannomutase family protein n=1 Tax=Mucilaginibacter straminoryzae TaxID=2932774 RepID=A0A9X2B8E1_9SPHI|nr:phosphoglucomutase/phosphomannomutase family protein [Mucilaginibacter straminoryzae]MCJ8209534.1 phosphoglucomutase/phosphomannomutase family protein [Mucilaginibacter straminoryzae]
MIKIKFGTDGWRAIIADDFTVENVKRVAYATALWLKQNFENPSAVVGNDPRFAGPLFADVTTRVLASEGIKVYRAENTFVSTPMISLGTVRQNASAGIIITASHNPPAYNGYKIKASYGGPATPDDIEKVESQIPDTIELSLKSLDDYKKDGLVEMVDLEQMYITHVENSFDLEAIRNSGKEWAYDAMYGAGQNVMQRLFPEITMLHCDHNPGFEGQAPEPIQRNLQQFEDVIKMSEGEIACGLVTDGDADRIGLYDQNGNFVDSHHILLLLIHYMYKVKGQRGEVYSTFSCTSKIQKLCDHYGLNNTVTKIGFKYICDLIVNSGKPFMVGGEESGGIAVDGHIPERDGIWIGLIIWEFMAKTGRSLTDLIQEIYDIVGKFAVERYDLHVTEELKQQIIRNCKSGAYKAFGSYNITRSEDLDGFKFFFEDGSWVMIRPSGTEPVLRVYSEAPSSEDSFKILDATKAVLLG